MLWWILGILALLIIGLLLLRVGAHAELLEGEPVVHALVGPFRFRVYPPKAQKPDRTGPPAEAGAKAKKKGKLPLTDRAQLRFAIRTLLPPLKKALGRVRKGVRIRPLRLSVCIGGKEDPAQAAVRYGQANALVWSVMPAAEELLDIREPHIHVGLDFDRPDSAVEEAEAAFSARVGTLLRIAFGLLIPAVRVLTALQKKEKPNEPASGTEAAADTAA